ncbi:SET domain containing protein [Rhypophila sp. PSN 637]
MDVHDVSHIPQHFEMLRAQQKTLDEAQARKGQSPFPRVPRMLLITQFTTKLMAKNAAKATRASSKQMMLRSSHTPVPYLPCTQPFANLNNIAIKDLVLETQHRGSYLLVRSVTPPDQLTALMTIVEDEEGDAIMLQLYHQVDNMCPPTMVSDTLPQGQALILKEPYLKVMANGGYGLRVDHLSDVLFLLAGDARIPKPWQQSQAAHKRPALTWKTEGNDNFRNSRFLSAITCYTHALGCSPTVQDAQTIKLNRALAYLKTKQYDAALSDVEAMTEENEPQPAEKGLFRKAEALYHLRRYRECCEVLKGLRIAYPNNKDAKALLNRAISRLAEETYGRYSFRQLHDETKSLRPPHLDRATFTGPVAVRSAGPRGRGLFTTKAVKAGDLLFCEKAFTHAFVDKDDISGRSGDMTILLEPGSRVTMGGQADLIDTTIRKLHQNPSLIPIINDLHHGSYQPVETSSVDGQPVVDSFLIRRIILLNSFGCPVLSTLQDSVCRKKSGNSQKAHSDRGQEDSPWHSTGLWPMASYINHSCTSNARRSFIGDMMIARATRDLEPDTEITWWYCAPRVGNTGGQRDLQTKFAHWGFSCDCSLCRDEIENGTPATTLQKRNTLLSGLEKYLSSPSSSIGSAKARSRLDTLKKTRTLVGAMQATYPRPATSFPRLSLWWGIQMGLMDVLRAPADYRTQEELLLMAELTIEGLNSLGYVIEGGVSCNPVGGDTRQRVAVKEWGLFLDGVVDCWSYLRDFYRLLGAEAQMVAEVEEYAKTAYRMIFGEDETFATYGDKV